MIVVMSEGRILEYGPPQELVEKSGGEYKKLLEETGMNWRYHTREARCRGLVVTSIQSFFQDALTTTGIFSLENELSVSLGNVINEDNLIINHGVLW